MTIRTRIVAATLVTAAVGSTSAAAQTLAPLSPARYAAIDATFAPRLKLTDPTIANVKAARAACDALPRTDLLLDRYRAFCEADVTATEGEQALCDSNRSCGAAIRRARAGLKAYVRTGRQLNRVLGSEMASRRCAQALDIGAREQRGIAQALSAYAQLQEAYRVRSPRQAREATRRLRRVEGTVTTREKRDGFRRACRGA